MAHKKKKSSKAKPSDLGSGAAANAAKKLQGRKAQLQEQERIAMGGKPRQKGKERK